MQLFIENDNHLFFLVWKETLFNMTSKSVQTCNKSIYRGKPAALEGLQLKFKKKQLNLPKNCI